MDQITDTAVIEYIDSDTGTVFRWGGGAYIEVGAFDQDQAGMVLIGADYHPSFVSLDVLNVWDDGKDRSFFEVDYLEGFLPSEFFYRRPFRQILEAFEARCQAYLTEAATEANA